MRKTLKIILVAIPFIIAGRQLYLTENSNLVRWKGGGFGMYTDPHPNDRYVWLKVNQGSNETKFIRIEPLDKKFEKKYSENLTFRKAVKQQKQFLKQLRNFPSSVNYDQDIKKRLAIFLENTDEDVVLFVSEITLDIDEENLKSQIIFTHAFD